MIVNCLPENLMTPVMKSPETIAVGGMTCAACVRRVEKTLEKVSGIGEVRVNLATGQALLLPDSELEVDIAVVEEAIVLVVVCDEEESVGAGPELAMDPPEVRFDQWRRDVAEDAEGEEIIETLVLDLLQ